MISSRIGEASGGLGTDSWYAILAFFYAVHSTERPGGNPEVTALVLSGQASLIPIPGI